MLDQTGHRVGANTAPSAEAPAEPNRITSSRAAVTSIRITRPLHRHGWAESVPDAR